MATTDYDFNLTRQQIIEAAFSKIGVLTPGQTLSGTDATFGALGLNVIIKDWRNKGIFLWQHEKFTVSTIVNTASYSLGNNIISLDKVYYTQSVNNDVPIEIISYRHYQDIEDKASTGSTPTFVALDYNISTPLLYVYPVPDSVYTISYIGVVRMQDMDTLSGYPQIPQEYLKALIYDLAEYLSADYSLPLRERQWLEGKADKTIYQAKKRDIEREDAPVVVSAFPRRRV